MVNFFTVVHVLLCVFMIFVILLQPGKDAGMGATLGGGAATSAFGGRGAVTFLTKLTAICATLFFITSLGLSFVGMKRSVAAGMTASTPATTPAAGAADAGAGITTQPAGEPATGAAAPAAPTDPLTVPSPEGAAPPSGTVPAAPPAPPGTTPPSPVGPTGTKEAPKQ